VAIDYFLKIDGIPGESADSKRKDEIDVEAWSWGESVAPPSTGGGGASRVQMRDLSVTARVSKASPALLLACATGKHLKSAVLSARRTGKDQADFLTYTLSDVLVSSFQTAGSEAAVGPLDSVALNFSKIQVEFRQFKADGSSAGSFKAGWDAKQNKQF
jgi:type VI secretion system secreted protein Hcp